MNTEDLIRIVEETGHHPMGPSGASRWMHCPGSVELTLNIPDKGNPYAREGTIAHQLGEICLREGVEPYQVEGFVDDMRYYIKLYVDYVRHIAGDNRIFVEQELDLSEYIPEGMGTADALIIDGDTLHVIDLKYGMRIVEAEHNPQLMIYALGALSKLRNKGIHMEYCLLHIYQPRAGGVRTWLVSVEDLLIFGSKVMAAADLCLQDDAPLNPSEKACEWCRAKSTCPALYQNNLTLVGGDFEVLPRIEKMSDDQLRLVLDNKGLIEKWLKGIEDHVQEVLERGESFDGFKLVEGRSIRKWNDDAETKLVKILGDAAYEKKLLGITAAEKALGKKHLAELNITKKDPGKPTVVPTSDKRPAIGVIADDFSEL